MIEKAFNKYRDGGLVHLIEESWRYLCDLLEYYSPSWVHRVIIQMYWLPYRKIIFQSDNIGYILYDLITGEKYYFLQLNQHRRFREQHKKRIRDIYYNSKFAPLEEDDVVVDVGAFIGITSLVAASDASKVYSIEASPRSFTCLKYNSSLKNNITPMHYAVLDENKAVDLRLGVDASDDSLLSPDEGQTGESTTVPARTLEVILSKINLTCVDFVKIEAEGVEPEILDGIGDINISKIAVNCDPERDSESPIGQVTSKLQNMGFKTYVGDDEFYTIVYGVKNNDKPNDD